MQYVEVVVNVPLRRTFNPSLQSEPSSRQTESGATESDAPLQTFHYHLPPELETVVKPGHLVWAPFGPRLVQGIVTRLVVSAPVATKAVARLARPAPILTPAQIELAAWIAAYYVAPFSEAIKLFVPPGLLQRDEGKPSVRARREIVVELALSAQEATAAVLTLGRETHAGRLLGWFLEHPTERPHIAHLLRQCGLKSPSALHRLVEAEILTVTEDRVATCIPAHALRQELVRQRGAMRQAAIVETLIQAGRPLWKSELNAQAPCDLAMLREMQRAGIIALSEQTRFRDPLLGRAFALTTPPPLTTQQELVWRAIYQHAYADPSQSNGASRCFLLHGVTGSGKTEIYLRAIAETLALGQQVIVLVPEIALTPQTIARFAGRFPERVTVIHSELSAGERYDVWRAVHAGRYDIVVGPRSALFAPMQKLGLIIIDEEHEGSYKQDSEDWGAFVVYYDARTVAQRLAQLTNSVLIAGSATPRLETYAAAVAGDFTLLTLPRRVMGHRSQSEGDEGDAPYTDLPPVEIVDMRQELRAGNRSIFSRSLAGHLHAALDAGEQAILFLNRRGAHTFILCRDCGHVEECPRCAVPLVYHERVGRLICHHCDRAYPLPPLCPACKSKRIKYFGSGTEQIETLVHEIAPHARLLRWDADTTTAKGSHEELMQRFTRHEADILIGTQMIAKGLDLPLVTLVGVISADVGLHLPDFRSSERTFQLLTQVAGRAGRSERGGRVVVQTYTPQHYAIQAAAQHDYAAFYRREIAFRQEQGYPPARRMARLVYWDKKDEKAKAASQLMARRLQHTLTEMGLEGKSAGILGPTPAFFSRRRGYYRWQLLLRAPDPAAVLQRVDIPLGWRIDIDPITVL